MKKAILIDDNKYDILILEKLIRINKLADELYSYTSPTMVLKQIDSLELSEGDYLFIDIMMPEMNGYELLQELSNMNIPLDSLNVILVSSSIDPRDIDKAKEYKSVKKLLQKPISSQMLLNATHQ